jgi:hypothetical protein
MDPLNKLWDLYESLLGTEMEPPSPTVGSPNEDDYEHPVTQERKRVDAARAAGMDPTTAHEYVYGELDTGDPDQKAQLAATLGRVQNDNNRKNIKIEKDAEFLSIMAKDEVVQKLDQVTPDDMRTPMDKEVPTAVQEPGGAEPGIREDLDMQEEFDYNFDVAYLQKYGRA